MFPVPIVHGREHRLGLVDGNDRSLRQDLQVSVGDEGGDLDDAILGGLQAGHFQVQPDQMVVVGFHAVLYRIEKDLSVYPVGPLAAHRGRAGPPKTSVCRV
jgi:hypothetical protein